MLEAELVDRMEAQHAEIVEAGAAVQGELPEWIRTAEADAGERILPLVAEHFTQQEWDAVGEHGFAAISRRRRLFILGHILEGTDDEERTRFLVNVPPPARLAFRLIGRRQFAREVAAVRGTAR